MRTTVNLDEALLREAKKVAAVTGRSLTAVIEDALRVSLRGRTARGPGKRVKLPTYKGTGLQPGVDLDDSAALLDVMEGRRDPA